MDLSAPVTGSVRPAAATSRRSFHVGVLPEIFCYSVFSGMSWFGLCAQSIWHKTILWRLQKDPGLGLNRPIQHWRSKDMCSGGWWTHWTKDAVMLLSCSHNRSCLTFIWKESHYLSMNQFITAALHASPLSCSIFTVIIHTWMFHIWISTNGNDVRTQAHLTTVPSGSKAHS